MVIILKTLKVSQFQRLSMTTIFVVRRALEKFFRPLLWIVVELIQSVHYNGQTYL